MDRWDLAVIGGGAIGVATAYYAARRGVSVVVLDDGTVPGTAASSAGAERQWRIQYAQQDLTALTLTALRLWRQLETESGRHLLHPTGSLWFGDVNAQSTEGQITAAQQNLDALGVAYEWLDARQIERRFGFVGLPAQYEGFFQPEGGVLDVQATLSALVGLARDRGVAFYERTRVERLTSSTDGVELHTTSGTLRPARVVVAAGAFANELLAPLGLSLAMRYFEMTSMYFALRTPALDPPTWFVFQQPTAEDSNLFYGFGRNPWASGDLVRVAPVFETLPLDSPRDRTRTPDPRHVERTVAWVRAHMPMLDPAPLAPSTCIIGLPTDHHRQFFLGPLPGVAHGERIVVQAGGWAFKFVPVFGAALADLALESATPYDVARFSLPRGEHAAKP
jgi:sarcosine oxidase